MPQYRAQRAVDLVIAKIFTRPKKQFLGFDNTPIKRPGSIHCSPNPIHRGMVTDQWPRCRGQLEVRRDVSVMCFRDYDGKDRGRHRCLNDQHGL